MNISDEYKENLLAWIKNEAETLKLVELDTSIFSNYILALFRKKANSSSYISGLKEFIGRRTAKQFTRKLFKKLESDSILQKSSDIPKLDSDFSDSLDEYYDSDDDEKQSEINDDSFSQQYNKFISPNEPDFKPKVPSERFIIFIAGIKVDKETITKIYKLFHKFGTILSIEVDPEEDLCFIEYLKLSSAYKAVKKGNEVLNNKFARIEFAKEQNEDVIAAIEKELTEEKDKESKQIEPQKCSTNKAISTISAKDNIEEEMKEMIKRLTKTYESLSETQSSEKEIIKIQINRLLKE